MNAFTRQEITAIRSHPTRPGQWRRPWVNHTSAELKYTPIVDALSGKAMAYEALETKFTAKSAFDQLKLHIEHSPAGKPLLVTLKLQGDMEGEGVQGDALLELLQQQLWSERELMVYLDHPDDGAWHTQEIHKLFQKAGISIVVDANATWDLPSINILIDAHAIRFNARELPETVEHLLNLAQLMGIKTLLANVSNASQVEWARQMGFDWLQGKF